MIFSVTLPSDGTNADVRDYNDPILQILAGLNGQLDDNNISSLNGSKITANTLPESALTDALKTGWLTQSILPTSITALGNRSYTVNYASSVAGIKSPGMRNRFTRSTLSPIQSASLNGTNQYFVKTSPNKMTWTNNFSVGAWIKLSSYQIAGIVSRRDGTQGWQFNLNASGQIELKGFNANLANVCQLQSYQSIPLNKWVYITAQLDMTSTTVSPTVNYVMIDGINVPSVVTRGGTNPTALVQAGNLEVGSVAAANFLPGKVAQLAIYSAKVTQAAHLAVMNQGLLGTETNLASAYSLSNSLLDLMTTTPNDLSVGGGSATTTNADSPFGNSGVSTTLEYGITTAIASDGLSETIQVPEGCVLPTTGGISAMSYSTQKTPYGFPGDKAKWDVEFILGATVSTASNATFAAMTGLSFNVPLGAWDIGWMASIAVTAVINLYYTLSDTNQTGLTQFTSDKRLQTHLLGASGAASNSGDVHLVSPRNLLSATTFTMYSLGSTTTGNLDASTAVTKFFARNAYL